MKNIPNSYIQPGAFRNILTAMFLALLCLAQAAGATAIDPRFGSITMADGLSNYSVMATYQDERGLLWIGTRWGLDVYDGTNIINHHRIPGDSTSPMNNYVKAITGDRDGHVFVLNIRGISIYDIAADRFTNIPVKQAGAMTFANGNLYYAAGRMIYTLSTDGRQQPVMTEIIPSDITALHACDSVLYIGTADKGLLRHDIHSGHITALTSGGNITCIFPDGKDRLWAGTRADGLLLVTPGGTSQFRHRPGDPGSLSSDFIRAACRDNRGRLWVGTFEGLSLYDPSADRFANFLGEPDGTPDSKAERQSHSSVWSLTCDRQGTLWIGTYFNGLLSYNPDNDIFDRHSTDSPAGRALSYPVTGEFAEDDNGRIWIATEGGGLNSLDPKDGTVSRHPDKSNNNIKALKYDPIRHCLWIGTHLGGLKRYDIATGRYSIYPLLNDKANIVCDIEIYKRDSLLLATHDGIYSFGIADCSFRPMFRTGAEGYVIALALDLALDHDGSLWIGGAEGGLYNYNFVTGRLNRYSHDDDRDNSLGSDAINFIYISPANDLWVGTSEAGLDKLDRERDVFIHHTHASQQLPSDCVYGARQLPDGRMLVVTDKALALMGDNTTTSYSTGGAVPLSAFNNKAIYVSADGSRAYVGGIDGMVEFAPDQLKPRETQYSVFPSRLLIDGREISTRDGSGVLPEALSVTKTLTLRGTQDYITIYYAITDFTHDNNLSPRYRLEGFSEDWQPLGADNGVNLTNLGPGDYKLHVQASDKPGSPESVLAISILPPLYLNRYAILVYFLTTVGMGWWCIRAYRKRMAMRQSLALERERSRSIEELNQSKLRFFINISNEFRTPLTLIIGKIESLMRSPQLPQPLLNKVNGAYTNCILMRDMMAELLEFRRYEQGATKIRVGEHNVVKFLADIHALFRDYAADKGIRFRFNRSNETLMLWYDPAQLRKVINNLLSNAFKHTEADGEVTLSVRRGDHSVIIEVSDTGCGIPAEDIDRIFDRFYQGKNEVNGDWQGIGVGLALSKGIVELHHGKIEVYSTPGESSTFTVTIPVGRDHFTDDEIADGNEYRQAQQYIEQLPLTRLPAERMSADSDDSADTAEDVMVIAEGNEQLRAMLADIFRPNFRVFTTGDGEEALQMIDENAPRLIVSGYELPGLSGVRLCRKVKSQGTTADTPFVFVSSHDDDREILEALNAGADDYLTLPFDVRQLLARCRNLLAKHSRLAGKNMTADADIKNSAVIAASGADIEFMQRAEKVIDDNIADNDFNIARFADAMNVSRTSLFLRIKNATGQTPNDFINSIKMRHAAKMLKEQPDTNVADIAYALGFSSPRYFSRCFKEYYRESPRSFRAGHNGSSEDSSFVRND